MPTREQMHSLAQEIIHSYEDRVAEIGQLQNTVETELQELFGSRAAMAQELRADLAKGVADRAAAVGTELRNLNHAHSAMSRQMKAALAKGVTDRQRDVGGLLRDFDQAHNTMGRETKAALAKGVADRQHDVGGLLRRFDRDLKAVRTALAGGQAEWRKLTATMQGNRAKLVAHAKPPPARIPPSAKAVLEAEAGAGPIEMTPETSVLRGRVFEYLANHPDGAKMTVLEEEFGTARIQMARMLKSLMDDNKVDKRDLLYFAI